MKNTKFNKTLITILCFAMVATISATAFATAGDPFDKLKPNTTGNGASSAYNIGSSIAGIIQVVGIITSVIVLMVLGIKYMMGSAEEKAEYKKTFIPYIVGAIILFAATAFAKTIYNWVQGISA